MSKEAAEAAVAWRGPKQGRERESRKDREGATAGQNGKPDRRKEEGEKKEKEKQR